MNRMYAMKGHFNRIYLTYPGGLKGIDDYRKGIKGFYGRNPEVHDPQG